VELRVDNAEALRIGYDSPKEALESELLGSIGAVQKSPPSDGDLRILSFEDAAAGVGLAVAVQWSAYFQEWEFLTERRHHQGVVLAGSAAQVGICIESIRVDFGSPGFDGFKICALCNASGPHSPKTNVARSGFENTPEGAGLIETIYRLYLEHVCQEMTALEKERGFSPSWAAREARYLLGPFFERASEFGQPEEKAVALTDPHLMRKALLDLPCMLVEQGGKRIKTTLRVVQGHDSFWTVESFFFRSAEDLLKEVPSSGSLSSLLLAVGANGVSIPNGTLLCTVGFDDDVHKLAFVGKEPISIQCHPAQRRLDVCWGQQSELARWVRFPATVLNEYRRERRFLTHGLDDLVNARICSGPVSISGFSGETAIATADILWLLSGTQLCGFLLKIVRLTLEERPLKQRVSLLEMVDCLAVCLSRRYEKIARPINELYEENEELAKLVPRAEFEDVLEATTFRIFNPWAWVRKSD
jgi:hypothetical protein